MGETTTEGTETETTTTTTTETEKPTLTQEQVNGIVARETEKASKKATTDLLKGLGFDSTDDLKGAVTALREQQEKSKTVEQRLAEVENESKSTKSKAKKYESTINSLLESRMSTITEEKRSLIPEFDDPADQLAYITKNEKFLIDPTITNVTVGTQTAPGVAPPTAPVAFKDYVEMNPREMAAFQSEFPEQAASYTKRLMAGE